MVPVHLICFFKTSVLVALLSSIFQTNSLAQSLMYQFFSWSFIPKNSVFDVFFSINFLSLLVKTRPGTHLTFGLVFGGRIFMLNPGLWFRVFHLELD